MDPSAAVAPEDVHQQSLRNAQQAQHQSAQAQHQAYMQAQAQHQQANQVLAAMQMMQQQAYMHQQQQQPSHEVQHGQPMAYPQQGHVQGPQGMYQQHVAHQAQAHQQAQLAAFAAAHHMQSQGIPMAIPGRPGQLSPLPPPPSSCPESQCVQCVDMAHHIAKQTQIIEELRRALSQFGVYCQQAVQQIPHFLVTPQRHVVPQAMPAAHPTPEAAPRPSPTHVPEVPAYAPAVSQPPPVIPSVLIPVDQISSPEPEPLSTSTPGGLDDALTDGSPSQGSSEDLSDTPPCTPSRTVSLIEGEMADTGTDQVAMGCEQGGKRERVESVEHFGDVKRVKLD